MRSVCFILRVVASGAGKCAQKWVQSWQLQSIRGPLALCAQCAAARLRSRSVRSVDGGGGGWGGEFSAPLHFATWWAAQLTDWLPPFSRLHVYMHSYIELSVHNACILLCTSSAQFDSPPPALARPPARLFPSLSALRRAARCIQINRLSRSALGKWDGYLCIFISLANLLVHSQC